MGLVFGSRRTPLQLREPEVRGQYFGRSDDPGHGRLQVRDSHCLALQAPWCNVKKRWEQGHTSASCMRLDAKDVQTELIAPALKGTEAMRVGSTKQKVSDIHSW